MRGVLQRVAVAVGVTTVLVAVDLAIVRTVAGPFPIDVGAYLSDTYVVVPVFVAGVLAMAMSPVTDVQADHWLVRRAVAPSGRGRRFVQSWLPRTRTLRGIGFFAPQLFGAVAGWSVNAAELPVGGATRQALVDLAGGAPDGWSFSLVGYALGALVAEVVRRRPPEASSTSSRRADLRPRVPSAYLQPLARWGPRVVAATAIVVGVAGTLWADPVTTLVSGVELVTVAAVTVALTEALRVGLVRRSQPLADPEAVALDDAARSTTVHAVSGTAIAIIGGALGTWAWNASTDWSGVGRWAAMVGGAVGPVTFGIWLAYGTGFAWVVRRDGRGSDASSAGQPT